MAYVMVLSLIFFLVLFFLLMDVGRTTITKVEMQDAADTSAYAAALWMARGMNAVTATNHHMGEMLSLVVLHKAIAGENVDGRDLDDADRRQADQLDVMLQALAPGAAAVGGWTSTYPDIAEHLRASETVGEGKLRLKEEVARIYAAQIAAASLPYGGAAIITFLNILEGTQVLAEWQTLDRMERTARDLIPARNTVLRVLLPAAQRYADEVVREVPRFAAETVTGLAADNHVQGAVFPARPQLPVEHEPFDARDTDHARTMAKTQIVRATFPWIHHHRAPVLSQTSWMLLSGASSLYRKWTDHDTTERAWSYYRRQRTTLYVMAATKRPVKGFEPWTSDPRETDRRFAVIGTAYRPSPEPFGAPALLRENQKGLVTYAQALLYNANDQNPTPRIGPFQAEIGWDTLNWLPPVVRSHAPEFPEGSNTTPGAPRIRLNWQVKLVPATPWLDHAAGSIPAPFGPVLRSITPVPQSSRTH
jgi:hypothetical protein